MSRACGWCSSRDREALERRIANGESIRLVSAEAGVSDSATYRHLRNHVRPDLLAQRRVTDSDLSLDHFADRLHGAFQDIAEVREYARRTNDGRLLLAAVAQERETVVALLDRLGIDGAETLDNLREARALVSATLAIMPAHPAALLDLAAQLRTVMHGAELAGAVEQATRRSHTDNPKEFQSA